MEEERLNRFVKDLIRLEDLKLKPYRCKNGALTIGIGRNLDANGISKEEALFMCHNDIQRCIAEVYPNIPFAKDLDESVQDVLLNMCFQMGISRLLGFKWFLHSLEKGDYIRASEVMLNSKWAREDSPNRAREMSERVKSVGLRSQFK